MKPIPRKIAAFVLAAATLFAGGATAGTALADEPTINATTTQT